MERIGVVLVHGIGEQGRFVHLSNEVRDILAALDANQDVRCSVDVRNTRDSTVGAERESWLAETDAPVRVYIRHVGGTRKGQHQCLEIHEVWWADLDDKATLWNRVKFWLWGLGMWGAKRFRKPHLPGAAAMRAPQAVTGRMGAFWARVALLGFAVIFLLTAVTLNLLNAVLRGMRLGGVGSDTLYRYVGDVKLYQDRGRPGKGPLEDRGLPPRVAIRRRMVAALVAAASANYDRWYVLGHSLGSVVAFNGLMETSHALPNYLSRSALHGAWHFRATNPDAKPCHVRSMSPRRPTWIGDDRSVLERKRLFRSLRGFVTYGSPLDKFAFLWPQIVNINEEPAFTQSFEWINIFDHTDPVAGHLGAFQNACGQGKGPRNFAYKASSVLLRSHTRYLKRGTNHDSASRRLLDWMLDGGAPFQSPRSGRGSLWYKCHGAWLGIVLRMSMWLPLAAAQSIAVGYLLNWLLPHRISGAGVLAAAGAIILVVGILRWLMESITNWCAKQRRPV